MKSSQQTTLIRASVLHFPATTDTPESDYHFWQDGALVMRNGKVLAVGDFPAVAPQYAQATVVNKRGKLLLPGLIDSHLHFPQTEMIASYGEQLLEWLSTYTFPTEAKFDNLSYAADTARVFLRQLLKNGTTSALVFSSVHKVATEALFQAASELNMLLVAGKVCMDRNCPEELRDTPEEAQRDSAALIDAWHNKGRSLYALTPRFAPTSSPAQMAALGELAQQYSDVFVQTHLSENHSEIAWVKSLYPQYKHYLDVYDKFHMVRQRAVFGHCLHLQDEEWQRIADAGATAAFCPTSNLFLGSGLFPLDRARQFNAHVTLATDVGAGTSFNLFRTLGEGYKVCQLQGARLDPLRGLYYMTQGAASAYQLSDSIGNLNPGTDADFVILDPAFDELSALRTAHHQNSPQSLLFAMSMLGDDRAIDSTWIAGECRYHANKEKQICPG